MSCPYLNERADGYGYCELASKRLSPSKVSGYCDTLSYEHCEYYDNDTEEETQDFRTDDEEYND